MKYFTKQWYKSNQKGLKKQNKNNVLADYNEHYKKIEPQLSNSIKDINMNNMHDGEIVNSGFYGKDFHLDINPINCYSSIKKIIFVNAEILNCDIDLKNACWLYEEVIMRCIYFFGQRTAR